MDAENIQLYEATLALVAWNKIYESLRFLKNWWQRSILLAKCNIEVLKSARDGNVTSPRKQRISQLEKITSYLKPQVVISNNVISDNINFLWLNERGDVMKMVFKYNKIILYYYHITEIAKRKSFSSYTYNNISYIYLLIMYLSIYLVIINYKCLFIFSIFWMYP